MTGILQLKGSSFFPCGFGSRPGRNPFFGFGGNQHFELLNLVLPWNIGIFTDNFEGSGELFGFVFT